jgi:hypothetical protein
MDGEQLDLTGSDENTQPLPDELSQQQQADSGQSQAEVHEGIAGCARCHIPRVA